MDNTEGLQLSDDQKVQNLTAFEVIMRSQSTFEKLSKPLAYASSWMHEQSVATTIAKATAHRRKPLDAKWAMLIASGSIFGRKTKIPNHGMSTSWSIQAKSSFNSNLLSKITEKFQSDWTDYPSEILLPELSKEFINEFIGPFSSKNGTYKSHKNSYYRCFDLEFDLKEINNSIADLETQFKVHLREFSEDHLYLHIDPDLDYFHKNLHQYFVRFATNVIGSVRIELKKRIKHIRRIRLSRQRLKNYIYYFSTLINEFCKYLNLKFCPNEVKGYVLPAFFYNPGFFTKAFIQNFKYVSYLRSN